MYQKYKIKGTCQHMEAVFYHGEGSFGDLKDFVDGHITDVYAAPWSGDITCLFTITSTGEKFNMLPGMALCRDQDGQYYLMSIQTFCALYDKEESEE